MATSYFLNTVVLGGNAETKLAAAAAAGFHEVEPWQSDVDSWPTGAAGVSRLLDRYSIGITDLQVMRDFDGAPDHRRDAKRAEALHILDTAVAIGAPAVAVAASTDRECRRERVLDDLAWFVYEAARRDLVVGYESLAWSVASTTLPEAWSRVVELDAPNLRIIIDSFHIFVHGRTAADLDGIPMDAILSVQLSDLPGTVHPDVVVETARHHRLMPGDGGFPLDSLLDRLRVDGYTGPVGLEVFNDDMLASDPFEVARTAFASLTRAWQPRASRAERLAS